MSPSKDHLEKHYEDLKEKPFFKGLVTCMHSLPPDSGSVDMLFPLFIFRRELTMIFPDMLSGPILAMVWEGREAVKTGRSKLPRYRALPRFCNYSS